MMSSPDSQGIIVLFAASLPRVYKHIGTMSLPTMSSHGGLDIHLFLFSSTDPWVAQLQPCLSEGPLAASWPTQVVRSIHLGCRFKKKGKISNSQGGQLWDQGVCFSGLFDHVMAPFGYPFPIAQTSSIVVVPGSFTSQLLLVLYYNCSLQ